MRSRTIPSLALLLLITMLAVFLLPSRAAAEPFGGQITRIEFCLNAKIYVELSGPRGGNYIWTAGTRTYPFGPPSHIGQWLLGLGSAPDVCVLSVFPLRVLFGTFIVMHGSSQ